MKAEAHMTELSLEQIGDLLGTHNIPGSEKEQKMLCIRIQELVKMNGENWIRQNRQKLLDEWTYIIRQEIIS